jgi:light-independent protochlorophyllide reductase subunit B
MQLAVWTYEGPPHVGAMRIATAMRDVHFVLHAPQGDTYADLLFTMIERRDHRPPVSYTTFQARDLGADTASLLQDAIKSAADRFAPQALLVGASCTAELIQDDPGGLARALGLDIPVIPLDLPSYQKKEHWGAAETFYQVVRALADPARRPAPRADRRPTVNLLGPCALGFRHRDDVAEVKLLLDALGVDVMVCAPMGARPADIARLGEADASVVLYPEIADSAARLLEKTFGQPIIQTVPIGVEATRQFVKEIAALFDLTVPPAIEARLRAPWWSASVDSTYLTGKRAFVFGDATHAIACARFARDVMGFEVVGLGCYNREFARELRAAAAEFQLDPLITDDHLLVEEAIMALAPEIVLGTQMERHIAKRLRIPCAVISAPVHVQDFPARYSPLMGFEGANVLFDTMVHPLVMGLEEHLLAMFRDDFEFHDAAGASHLGRHGAPTTTPVAPSPAVEPMETRLAVSEVAAAATANVAVTPEVSWSPAAEKELSKIPFFVRGKARRNAEQFAATRGLSVIDVDTLYDAKAHFAR